MADKVSRRGFIAGAAGVGALLATGGTLLGGGTGSSGAPVVRNPLALPPTTNLGSGAYTLTAASGRVDIGGGTMATGLVYNGTLPGPTLRARAGDNVQLTLKNQLTQDTTTHWHGMVVDHANDGHPMMHVAPGGTYNYAYPIRQRAALNWYHPHPHGLTGPQVALGLAGAFIINDAEEDAAGLPSGAYEVPLLVKDTQIDRSGNLKYVTKGDGFLGDFALVNGTRDAYLNVDTAVYRLRVLNASNARVYGLTLSNGAAFTIVGNDGGLLTTPTTATRIDMAPAERLDLLVDFRSLAVGATVSLTDANSGWNLVEFRVARQVSVPFTLPSTLSSITQLANPVRTRSFTFGGMNQINGLSYDMNRIDFRVPFGETELWRFSSQGGNGPHPVHVHGVPFQVVSRTGGRGRLYPWESGWKDTVLVQDQESVDVLIRFDVYRSLYVMHCHKLEHEDMGMMMNFEVY